MVTITGKRIRSLSNYIQVIKDGTVVVPTTPGGLVSDERLAEVGLEVPLAAGDTVLPAGVGPVSRRNSEGDLIIHRDQPKETVYHHRLWTREQWNGPDTVTVTDVVAIPYERYPRTRVPPVGDEIMVVTDTAGNAVLATPATTVSRTTSRDRVREGICGAFVTEVVTAVGLNHARKPRVSCGGA